LRVAQRQIRTDQQLPSRLRGGGRSGSELGNAGTNENRQCVAELLEVVSVLLAFLPPIALEVFVVADVRQFQANDTPEPIENWA